MFCIVLGAMWQVLSRMKFLLLVQIVKETLSGIALSIGVNIILSTVAISTFVSDLRLGLF